MPDTQQALISVVAIIFTTTTIVLTPISTKDKHLCSKSIQIAKTNMAKFQHK